MVKHNNVIPNVHLRKHWQKNVKTWLNQAARKKRRLNARRAKAQANAPRPLENLQPAVRCQTIRYNHRVRLGRGFTLAEIKSVGLGLQFARSIGISVDHRRQNRCQESFDLNRARLTNYLNKLVLYPKNEKSPVTKAKSGILNDTPKENQKVSDKANFNALPPLIKRVKAVSAIQLDQLRKGHVFKTVRQEWSNQRNQGKRIKKQKIAAQLKK